MPVMRFVAPGPERRHRDGGAAGQAAVDVGHERRALLVAGRDVPDRLGAAPSASRTSIVSSPGTEKTYSQPSAARQSTRRWAAVRAPVVVIGRKPSRRSRRHLGFAGRSCSRRPRDSPRLGGDDVRGADRPGHRRRQPDRDRLRGGAGARPRRGADRDRVDDGPHPRSGRGAAGRGRRRRAVTSAT